MKAHQASYPIATMCRVLAVSTSGYYAWHKRSLSTRTQVDLELLEQIQAIHARSDRTYGAPRIHKELTHWGICVGKKLVARLIRQANPLRGQPKKGCENHTPGEAGFQGTRSGEPRFYGLGFQSALGR